MNSQLLQFCSLNYSAHEHIYKFCFDIDSFLLLWLAIYDTFRLYSSQVSIFRKYYINVRAFTIDNSNQLLHNHLFTSHGDTSLMKLISENWNDSGQFLLQFINNLLLMLHYKPMSFSLKFEFNNIDLK